VGNVPTLYQRRTPEVTVEAIRHAVRTRGLAALKEPAIRERLLRCDEAALETLDDWLTKFKKDKESAADQKPRAG
jgi:hypothetical protein